MDNCGICLKPADQLFETGKDGVYACFKCQPLVPEVTIGDNTADNEHSEPQASSTEEENSESSLYCGICHKSFQKNMQLQNHLRNHRAERRFVCTYCDKAFSQSNNLRAHLRIHTNERPFKCTECGKAFTQVTNLNNHVRLHTGERPFVCPEPGCNKAYAQVTNLNQHRKRHLTGRPVETSYDCTICGEQFQQRNHMYSHRRSVHPEVRSPGRGEGRHVCGVCDAALPSDRLLRLHRATHTNTHIPTPLLVPTNTTTTTRRSTTPDDECGSYRCVFSVCGAVLSSRRAHTDHLLRAHQLRVLAPATSGTGAATAPAATPRSRRGRPPKILKDPLAIDPKDIEYHEVKMSKQPQYLPKLKVQSLFQ